MFNYAFAIIPLDRYEYRFHGTTLSITLLPRCYTKFFKTCLPQTHVFKNELLQSPAILNGGVKIYTSLYLFNFCLKLRVITSSKYGTNMPLCYIYCNKFQFPIIIFRITGVSTTMVLISLMPCKRKKKYFFNDTH